MKRFGLWVLLILVGFVASILFFVYSSIPDKDSVPELGFHGQAGDLVMKIRARKLKEIVAKEENRGDVNLQDYHPIDPSPTTKASVRPGPIEHGTPLNPYIPKPPSPSDQPGNGG